MSLLDGKVVLVTGGARGQGRAHAIASAREGADVALFDLVDDIETVKYPLPTPADLDVTVKGVEGQGRRAISFVGDVRSASDLDGAVAATISEFGKIDAVVANAGIWTLGASWKLTQQQWDETLGINLTGVWQTAKAVAPHMIERQEGSIVMIASVDAFEAGGVYAHYIAAKHGVLGLMKGMAFDLAPHGVRCNAICPGAVDSPMIDNQPGYDLISGHANGNRKDLIEGGHRFNLLKGTSLLDPMNVADAAVFLHSPLASRITGVALPVDAGHVIMPGYNHEPVL